MKTYLAILASCLFLFGTVVAAKGQGVFQNLNFESVQISPPDQRGSFPFADVFPGWTGYIGTNQATQAAYNGISAGAALCSLVSLYTPFESSAVISGTFTAVIAAGEINPGPNGILVPASLAQSGLIPLSAQSLRFSLGSIGSIGDLLVTFNGQNVPFFPLSSRPNYTVYGVDISGFSGSTGELRFTESPISRPSSRVFLDDIFFSNQPIPEPSVFGLFTLGGLLLGWRFLCRRY